MKNLEIFKMTLNELACIHAGDRVYNSKGKKQQKKNDCAYQTVDGFYDDNNDGVQQCSETQFVGIEKSNCPPSDNCNDGAV